MIYYYVGLNFSSNSKRVASSPGSSEGKWKEWPGIFCLCLYIKYFCIPFVCVQTKSYCHVFNVDPFLRIQYSVQYTSNAYYIVSR